MKSWNENTDRPLKAVLAANWGLGLEILRYLWKDPRVTVERVVTQHRAGHDDPWINVVHDEAVALGLPVTDQADLTVDRFKAILLEQKPDLLLVHAYMKRLPVDLLTLPALGCVNIHASLLPRYRGRAPVFWALRNQDTQTGLTAHFMDAGFDTGDIIHQVSFPLTPEVRIETVLERQKDHIGALLEATLHKLTDPGFRPTPQDSKAATYAPRPADHIRR